MLVPLSSFPPKNLSTYLPTYTHTKHNMFSIMVDRHVFFYDKHYGWQACISHIATHLEMHFLQVELGFGNGVVDDIFFVPGYDIHGFVVAQVNLS